MRSGHSYCQPKSTKDTKPNNIWSVTYLIGFFKPQALCNPHFVFLVSFVVGNADHLNSYYIYSRRP